jgi:hypothetical protein
MNSEQDKYLEKKGKEKREKKGELKKSTGRDGGLTHLEQDNHLERGRKKNPMFRNNGISILVVMVLLQAQQPGAPVGCLLKVRVESCPLLFSSMLKAPHPLCCMSFSISSLFSFFFFLFEGRGSVCPGGYAGLSQGWLWEYHVPLTLLPVGSCPPSRFGTCGVWRGSPPVFSM